MRLLAACGETGVDAPCPLYMLPRHQHRIRPSPPLHALLTAFPSSPPPSPLHLSIRLSILPPLILPTTSSPIPSPKRSHFASSLSPLALPFPSFLSSLPVLSPITASSDSFKLPPPSPVPSSPLPPSLSPSTGLDWPRRDSRHSSPSTAGDEGRLWWCCL